MRNVNAAPRKHQQHLRFRNVLQTSPWRTQLALEHIELLRHPLVHQPPPNKRMDLLINMFLKDGFARLDPPLRRIPSASK